jgi:hypothetical protein
VAIHEGLDPAGRELWRTLPYAVSLSAQAREDIARNGHRILPTGGETACALVDDATGDLASVGYAYCEPRDTFDPKLGRRIAQGRALAALALTDDLDMRRRRRRVIAIAYPLIVAGQLPWRRRNHDPIRFGGTA